MAQHTYNQQLIPPSQQQQGFGQSQHRQNLHNNNFLSQTSIQDELFVSGSNLKSDLASSSINNDARNKSGFLLSAMNSEQKPR